ncbi:MAG: hypothetical protein ACREQ5_40760, partial [Candidatus Dormibacteria bacterium]
AANGLVTSGRDVPVGRMMGYQTPMVGMAVDDAVRGTVVDKVLQPFAKGAKSSEMLGAVIGPPLIVGWIERHPDKAPGMMPVLRYLIAQMLVSMAPAVKASQEREAAMSQTLAEMFPDLEHPEEAVNAIIESLFATGEVNESERATTQPGPKDPVVQRNGRGGGAPGSGRGGGTSGDSDPGVPASGAFYGGGTSSGDSADTG